MNLDLNPLIKEYVNSVPKPSINSPMEFIYVVVANDVIIIDVSDTTLAFIPLDMCTNMYSGIVYPGDIQKSDKRIFDHVLSLWEKYDQLVRYTPIEGSIEDLRAISDYENLISLKASDGAGFFMMPGNNLYQNFVIPVFTGFPGINAKDKIGVIVRRIDYKSLLVEYNIYKAKIKKNIKLYFTIMDMNRRLLDEQFTIR